MSDDVKQPVPGQGAVSPVVQASGAGQSGTPAESAQEQASQQGTEEAKPVTTQDLAAMEARIREETRREIQSQVDKRDAKVREKLSAFDASIAQLKIAGKELPEAEVKDLRAKVAQQAREEVDSEITSPSSVPDWTDVSKWDQTDPIVSAVLDAQREIGIVLTADMPEAKSVIRDQGPRKFLKSYEEQLIAAKNRLSASEKVQPTKPSAPPAARIPSQGSSGGQPAGSGRDLLERAHKND